MPSRLKALVTVLTVLAMPATSLSPLLAQAPAMGRLEGKVLASEGAPVEGAVILVRSLADEQEHASAPTNAEGAYSLDGLPSGDYAIAVRTEKGVYLGARSLKVSAMAGQTYSFRIEDKPRAEIMSMVGPDDDGSGGGDEGDDNGEKKKKKKGGAVPGVTWVDNPLVALAAGIVFVVGTGALIEAVDDEDDDEDNDGSPSGP